MRMISARFRGPDQARRAMDALQRGGIEGRDISLHGEAIEAAEDRPRERERAGMHHIALRVLLGAAIGTIGGALLGAGAGLVMYGMPDRGLPDGFIALTIGGALAVGAVSAIAAGVMTLDLTERWELTFGHTTGGVVVAVTSHDTAEIKHAKEILASHGGADVRESGTAFRATG